MAPAPPMSPQKRVTRARAAAKMATDGSKTSDTTVTSKVSTRQRKGAAESKSAQSEMAPVSEPLRQGARRVGTSASARRIKITPLNGTTCSQQALKQCDNISEHQGRTRATRARKDIADEVDGDEADVDQPQMTMVSTKQRCQTGSVKKAKETPNETAPKPRGRPKKAKVTDEKVTVETENVQKQLRARAGSGAAKMRALAMPPSKTAVPKKTVSFQVLAECDKENQPVLHTRGTTKGKSAVPANGIRAKPIRRPASTSKATAKETLAKAAPETTAQRVLTPKKVRQVAKSSPPTDSDEDELNGAKTPVRDLSQSPRRNANIVKMGSPVKKLDFGGEFLVASPARPQLTSTLLSPAKRPAASPVKAAFNESPKRGGFLIKAPQTPKPIESENTGETASSGTMLLQSPKRVTFETPIKPQSPSKAGKSPFKASLLQSPPRRPISPVKVESTVTATQGPPSPTKNDDAETMSPNMTVSSHWRASQSPGRSSRVRKLTSEELAEEAMSVMDFDQSIIDIRSPPRLEKKTTDVLGQNQADFIDTRPMHCLTAQAGVQPGAQDEEPMTADDRRRTQPGQDVEVKTPASGNIMLQTQTHVNAAAFLFRSSCSKDEDESSEDELQSPVRMLQAKTPAPLSQIESRVQVINQVAVEQNNGFTPLATQLSGWLASSPSKQLLKKNRPRGIFSPIAAQHVPGEVVIDRRSPVASRMSTESRLSTSTRQSSGRKNRLGQETSLSISTNGTPEKSSYFADEMVVKDLEAAIESMQAQDPNCALPQEANGAENVDDSVVEDFDPLEVVERAEQDQTQPIDDSDEPQDRKMEDIMAIAPHGNVGDLPEGVHVDPLTEGAEDKQQVPETSQDYTSSSHSHEDIVPTTPTTAVLEEVVANAQEGGNTPTVLVPPMSHGPVGKFTTPRCHGPKMTQYANTVVSKVPLRPEGHGSPIKLPKKRSRSLSAGRPSVKKTPIPHITSILQSSTGNTCSPARSTLITPSSAMETPGQLSFAVDDFGDSTLDGIEVDEDDENLPPTTPATAGNRSFAMTPSKNLEPQTPGRPGGILQGAVVFVDVHTTEGADASGIFVELLNQMGAKCMRTWAWNPRATLNANGHDPAAADNGKIGITHVVYKDGGKRTLEKVRETEGVVKCIGVGWVLE